MWTTFHLSGAGYAFGADLTAPESIRRLSHRHSSDRLRTQSRRRKRRTPCTSEPGAPFLVPKTDIDRASGRSRTIPICLTTSLDIPLRYFPAGAHPHNRLIPPDPVASRPPSRQPIRAMAQVARINRGVVRAQRNKLSVQVGNVKAKGNARNNGSTK